MTPSLFLLFIILSTASLVYLHRKSSLLQNIPLILLLYLSFMIVGNLNLWDATNSAIISIQKISVNNLLPAMIFLMMLGFNIRLFQALGSKLLIAFFATTFSLLIAFVTIFYLFEPLLWEDANLSFATLSGSWSGGSINMIAIGKIINISEAEMANVIVVDSVVYTLWVMFLLLLVPFAQKFNHFTKSSIKEMNLEISCALTYDIKAYIRIIIMSIAVAFIVNLISYLLPEKSFLSPTFYAVVLATIIGILASRTPLKELPAQGVANSMLYLIIAMIASKAYISELSTTLIFFACAVSIIILHALLMILFAKLFKLDLFSIAVASLAHIGGTAGATILASAYHKNMIPVAVVMATGGYLIGTFLGLLIAYLLGV